MLRLPLLVLDFLIGVPFCWILAQTPMYLIEFWEFISNFNPRYVGIILYSSEVY